MGTRKPTKSTGPSHKHLVQASSHLYLARLRLNARTFLDIKYFQTDNFFNSTSNILKIVTVSRSHPLVTLCPHACFYLASSRLFIPPFCRYLLPMFLLLLSISRWRHIFFLYMLRWQMIQCVDKCCVAQIDRVLCSDYHTFRKP